MHIKYEVWPNRDVYTCSQGNVIDRRCKWKYTDRHGVSHTVWGTIDDARRAMQKLSPDAHFVLHYYPRRKRESPWDVRRRLIGK